MSEAKTPSLKPQIGPAPVGQSAEPSALARGVNILTVQQLTNHWREYRNPLPGLTLAKAIALWDFQRRGLNAELQSVFREIEQLDATLIGLIERRMGALSEMDWKITTTPDSKLPKGATKAMAEAQAQELQTAYDAIDNLREAIEWMEHAAFRGYSHLEKVYANPGTSDLTICHLEPVEQWHWTRKSIYAAWEYVASAAQTNQGVAINEEQWIITESKRPINRLALIFYIRKSLSEKDWDSFSELYDLPRWIIIMPPDVPKDQEAAYLESARMIASGGSGTLPNGADAKVASPGKSNDAPFRPRLEWLQEQLVLAGTGGMLTMLALPTGIGKGSTDAHQDGFQQIAKRQAVIHSEVFQQQFDWLILRDKFPGQPILARFEIAAHEEMDVSSFIADVASLASAGYQVDPQQIEEKTGYKVTLKTTEAPDPEEDLPPDDLNTPPSDDEDAPPPITNRTITDDTSLEEATAKQLAADLRLEFSHLLERLAAISQIADPELQRRKWQALQDEFPDVAADLIADPAAAKTIGEAIAAGLVNGVEQKKEK
jgi:phage gp29-like protein